MLANFSASRKVISSGSGTTSSQPHLPAATISSLSTGLGCSGAVTQMLSLRMTPAARAARRSTERLTPSGPTEVTAHTGMPGSASARPASGSSTTASVQPAAPKQLAAAASSAASCGRASAAERASAVRASRPSSTGASSMQMRSDSGRHPAWYRPAWIPCACRMAASRRAVTVLPAVPATPTNCTFCTGAVNAARSCSVEAKPSGRAAKY